MGRYTGPQCRLCRAEETKLFLKGERCKAAKCPITKRRGKPGRSLRARSKKLSDYGIQLREKQKLKRMYGMMEKQFRLFFAKAARQKGITGETLITMLERRLDNMVYRMHFASSRKQGRQLVSHGHVRVNARRVTIPSYLVREGDEIEVQEKSKKLTAIKDSLKEYSRSGVMPWLEVDPDKIWGKVKAIPRRSDIFDLADVKEQLIVELYSK
ncbi:MAG: 30S ribosomal protein S4 [Spirochaetia bacterium]|nr:30S ribosomal protein S4 [Spirochaetales bacterium]